MSEAAAVNATQYVGMDTASLRSMAASKSVKPEEKAAAVATQFESVMVKQYLKQALKPLFKGVLNEDGGAAGMYKHFFTDAMAESIARGGGFGLSSVLQAQLSKKLGAEAAAEAARIAEQAALRMQEEQDETLDESTDG